MRLLLFADPTSPTSVALAEAALQDAARSPDVEVVGLVDASRVRLTRPLRVLRWHALRRKCPLLVPPGRDVNASAFVTRVRDELRPDAALNLMAPQIFRAPLLEACGRTANYHDALLPRYRGVRATNWSVYEGEARSGFTFHLMSADLDGGPILLQDAVDVPAGATITSVKKAKIRLATARMAEALALLATGDEGRPQEGEPSGFTFADVRALTDVGDAATITWEELERRLRAFRALHFVAGGVRHCVVAVGRAGQGSRRPQFVTADGVRGEVVRGRSIRAWRRFPLQVPVYTRSGGMRGYATKLVFAVPARLWRAVIGDRVVFVGITGSTGKSTARRLTHAVLSTAGRTRGEVVGSRNRMRGVLYTLLTTTPLHRFSVQELGVSGTGSGSMDQLLWPVVPDVAVVTTAAWDHRSAFGGPEGVAREKGKLVEALGPHGIAVLNADDPLVRELAARAPGRRIVLYGRAEDADVRGEDVGIDADGRLRFTLVTEGGRFPVTTRLIGTHWITAALAALATGVALGADPAAAATALARVDPLPNRLSLFETPRGVTFLQDDWKASPGTIEPAFEALAGMPAQRRVAVLGQLSDDPRAPRKLYRATAALARRHADLVVLVGRWAPHGLKARSSEEDRSIVAFTSRDDADAYLRSELRAGDVVLTKGSGDDETLRDLPRALFDGA